MRQNINYHGNTIATSDGSQTFIEIPVIAKLYPFDGLYLGAGALIGLMISDEVETKNFRWNC